MSEEGEAIAIVIAMLVEAIEAGDVTKASFREMLNGTVASALAQRPDRDPDRPMFQLMRSIAQHLEGRSPWERVQ